MTPTTTSCEFGDVVLVGFPFTNLQTTKQRPAVVISSSPYNQYCRDVILLAITSHVRQPLAFGECLVHEWQPAGLLKLSLFKPLIATVEQARITRCLGHLTASDMTGMAATLRSILGQHRAE